MTEGIGPVHDPEQTTLISGDWRGPRWVLEAHLNVVCPAILLFRQQHKHSCRGVA